MNIIFPAGMSRKKKKQYDRMNYKFRLDLYVETEWVVSNPHGIILQNLL